MNKSTEDKYIHTIYESGLPEPELAMLKWLQLSKYCTDNSKDFYIELYSRLFKIPYNEVTSDQRAEAKHYFIGIIYSYGDMPEPPAEID